MLIYAFLGRSDVNILTSTFFFLWLFVPPGTNLCLLVHLNLTYVQFCSILAILGYLGTILRFWGLCEGELLDFAIPGSEIASHLSIRPIPKFIKRIHSQIYQISIFI